MFRNKVFNLLTCLLLAFNLSARSLAELEPTEVIDDEDNAAYWKETFDEPEAQLDGLAEIPDLSVAEIEELRFKPKPPTSGPQYDKIIGLLTNYDLAQPTDQFQLGPKLRVASFNIRQGLSLDRLKLVLNPDPVLQELMEEFPEIIEAETLNKAKVAIRKEARLNGQNPAARVSLLYDYLGDLLNSEESNFREIFPLKKLSKGFLRKRSKLYEGVYVLAHEVAHLASADIISLQEVDWGMPRTNYAHVVRELAQVTGYGYAYGTEFIELLDSGTAYPRVKNLQEDQLRALHGSAILSKWPLKNVKILRFKESFTEDPKLKEMKHRRCYNWLKEEQPKVGPFERLIYQFGKIVFKEIAIVPSVRIGSRMALMADVYTPAGPVKVISTHLENRGSPKCRRSELQDILDAIKDETDKPIVLAGDLNTTNEEARRPYFRHFAFWYLKNQFELSTLIANIGTSAGVFFLDLPFPVPTPIPATVQLINQAREWRNPPGIGSAERKLFRKQLQNFRFSDGTVFDTRGTPSANKKRSKRLLANSNQTTPIGYKPTYCFERNYKHLFCMKLDWIFVKNDLTKSERCHSCPTNDWAPTNPRTLYQSMLLGGLSDHAAITTDLIVPNIETAESK
jgi:endonuclease/exonuclease/phosphatase family metal-dependent hydrolase